MLKKLMVLMHLVRNRFRESSPKTGFFYRLVRITWYMEFKLSGLKLRFIKPCRETDSSPKLTVSRVIENKRRKTETSLLLDLNILIRMEDVILKGSNPADLGLIELVNFLNQCPPGSICLTPGLALSEVHPRFKKQCLELFEVFISIFCPQMVDHPTATRDSETELEEPRRLEFDELPIGEQYLHSISYYSFTAVPQLGK